MGAADILQPVDLDAFQAQVIRQLGAIDPVHEEDAQPVDRVKHPRLIVTQNRRAWRLGLHQRIGPRELPVFVAPLRQPHGAQPVQSCRPRGPGAAHIGHLHGGQSLLGGRAFAVVQCHHATSARISEYPLFSTSSASSGPPDFTMRPSAMICTTSGLI